MYKKGMGNCRVTRRPKSRHCCTVTPLATAFKRMAADNLANLNPHPLYVAFHYTHPPLLERVDCLEQQDQPQAPPEAHPEVK